MTGGIRFANIVLFPERSEEEISALAADIKQHGLQQPILTQHGAVVDGRARLAACKEAKVAPVFHDLGDMPDVEVVGMVVQINLATRELTPSQRAAIAVELEQVFSGAARERMRQGGRIGGLSQERRQRARSGDQQYLVDPFAGHTVADRAERAGTLFADFSRSGKTRDLVSKMMDVSTGYVAQAKQLGKDAPDLLMQVKSGVLTIQEALRIKSQRSDDRHIRVTVTFDVKSAEDADKFLRAIRQSADTSNVTVETDERPGVIRQPGQDRRRSPRTPLRPSAE